MALSRTLCLGMDVHKDAMAVAYGAQEPGPRSPPVAALAPAHVTLLHSSVRCPPQPHR
jgi:hypothetical protein